MIGIITINPQVYNYGGFLQEMALQDILKKLGYESEIINYEPQNEMLIFSMKRGIQYFSIHKMYNKLKDKWLKSTDENKALEDTRKRKMAFDVYRKENLSISLPYDYEQLHSGMLPYTTLICGSDQIWNPDYSIPAFFLDFPLKGKKIAYAASIGKDKLTYWQKKRYRELLKNLDYISVREKSAVDIIGKLIQKDVELVLDPTLLHVPEYWINKAIKSSKKYQNYIFCYFLEISDAKIRAAEEFGKKMGCKLVVIPHLHGNDEMEFGDIKDPDVSPGDFLKMIYDAKFILTDSFHASVFSILFQKKFYVFGRKSNGYSMNTRLETLLEYIDAKDLLIQPRELAEVEEYKYQEFCMDKILQLQTESLHYISNAFES